MILLLSILLLLLSVQRYINCFTKSELLRELMDEMENITYTIQERIEVTGGNYFHDSWHWGSRVGTDISFQVKEKIMHYWETCMY